MSERYQSESNVRIFTSPLFDATGALLTGLADVLLRLRRKSDGLWRDFGSSTWTATGTTQVMTELDATRAPGVYVFDFDTAGEPENEYYLTITSATAVNDPQTGVLLVGDYVDSLFGLLKENSVIDNVTANAAGFVTAARLRQFATKALADAATKGAADNADGEIRRWLITANPTIVGGSILQDYKLTREL